MQSSGDQEMRRIVSDFFFNWVACLTPEDLTNELVVVRLAHLVEVRPEDSLPILRGLVEQTPTEELVRLHSGYEREKARRQLVWLAEKLTCFAESFRDAEAILFRLALAETEPHLGNNASSVWSALFRIVLLGTPVPFAERLRLLEDRLSLGGERAATARMHGARRDPR